MKSLPFKKILPYLLVVLGFVALAYGFMPQILGGKVIQQEDISSWRGMSQETRMWNKAHPKDPAVWTNSMFSGMPTYVIGVKERGNWLAPVHDLLMMGKQPANILIISLLGSLLLFLALGTPLGVAALGAVALTFCAYNFQIIQVGHINKMIAMAYMPWVMAALVYAYKKNTLLGAVFFGLAMFLEVRANHVQITYYLAFVVLFYVVAQAITAFQNKAFPRFVKTSLLLAVMGVLGIATNANRLLPLYEYSKYSIRAGSELRGFDPDAALQGAADGTSTAVDLGDGGEDWDPAAQKGLDLEYATQWSYGPGEMFNLLIPNFNGGASVGELSKSSASYRALKENNYAADQIISGLPLYWGPQPFTAGPMYMGAILIFLFVLGLCLVKGPFKWAAAGVSLLAVLLSWGSHFMWFTELFFNYVPLYNKFRTVSMILVILQLVMPMLGMYALTQWLRGQYPQKQALRALAWSTGLTAGFCLLCWLMPSIAGSFQGLRDTGLPRFLMDSLQADRRSLLTADALRSFLFIAAAAALLFFNLKHKLKAQHAVLLLLGLMLLDYWPVGKRYLNHKHFVSQTTFNKVFAPRPADKLILQDKDPYYRVLDLSVNTFNDSHVSYLHKTVGGYNAAKLQRYQDLIDYAIDLDINAYSSRLSECKTYEEAARALQDCPALAMLNTKYVILDGNQAPVKNPYCLGNAWFVHELHWAGNAKEEMAALLRIQDIGREAVVFRPASPAHELDPALQAFPQSLPSGQADTLTLTAYSPNQLEYTARTDQGGLAVFSEMHYPAGWKAWIDEKPVPILRANYTLRALYVPAGEHKVRFRFEPTTLRTAETISAATSALLWLLLAGSLALCFRRQKA